MYIRTLIVTRNENYVLFPKKVGNYIQNYKKKVDILLPIEIIDKVETMTLLESNKYLKQIINI